MKLQSAPLEAFCQIGSGTTPSRAQSEKYFGGNVPWVKSGELREGLITKTEEYVTRAALDETALKLVPKGAILLAMYGATVGRIGMLGIEATTNQAVCHILPDTIKADTRYIYHALRSCVPEFIAKRIGGAQPNISQQVVRQTRVFLPPLNKQRRIAAILDQADALRAKRRAALAQLDEMARAIFAEMFGDPATNPLGWPTGRIGDLLSAADYGTSEKAGAEGSLPILRMNNITHDGKLDTADLKFIELEERHIDKYTVRRGDVLFNRTNSPELVGKTAVFDRDEPFAFAGYLVRLRTNEKAVPEYISGFLNSRHGKAVLRGICKSIIGMANINAREFQSISIPCPPRPLQDRYAARLKAVAVARAKQEEAGTALVTLFASLQHRAFRGEL